MSQPQHPREPLVTAMVSTYASERYLRGCLNDLLAQSIADRLEIVVVDACSPEGEAAIVREYQQRHDNIVYLRSEQRERSSLSFNRATAVARGRYLTTANTDDRHHPEFFARMTAVLEQHPEFGIVYADSLVTQGHNETWARHTATRRYSWPDYSHATALSCCLFGAQPVWRRSVHAHVGPWDPDRCHANDQDMFLRIALRFGAVHLRETLGLFLARPDSVSGSDNRRATLDEVLDVMRHYRTATPLEVLFPALAAWPGEVAAQASLWFELGNLCALGPYTDADLALQCYQRAVALPLGEAAARQARVAFATNTANVLACAGIADAAARAWSWCRGDRIAQQNEQRCLAAAAAGRRPSLRELEFVDFLHPVLVQSRTTRGLARSPQGALQWTADRTPLPWDVFDGPSGVLIPAAEKVWSLPLPASEPLASAAAEPLVLLVMYGWADSGGGTMLPRAFAQELAARGGRVAVFYAAAAPAPELPPYALRRHREGPVQLFALCNRPTLFMDLQAPAREIDDPRARAVFAALLDELQPSVVHFWNLHNLGMSLPAECRSRAIPTVLSSNNYWAICPRLYLVSEHLQRCAGSQPDGGACAACLGTPDQAAAHAQRKRAGIRMLREDIDVHLAVSQRVRELYVQNGDDPEHVRVLRQEPAAVAELWAQVGSRRRVVDVLRRPLRVGFLGSVMAHKGVHVLVQALQLLPAGAVECVVLGDLTPDYQAWLQRLDTGRAVHFYGRYGAAQLPALLAKFDVIVVPSVWDDCAPFVVAEALAAGCPVLGSRIGGIPDFVQHGQDGLLFAPGDASALAACLQAFGEDPTLLGRLQRGIVPPRGLAAFVDDVAAVYGEVAGATTSP